MAEEIIESTEQEPIDGGDPFADAKAEDNLSQSGQSDEVKAAQQETTPVETEAQSYTFGDTPYESEKDAVAGYKHLQANYTRTTQELSVLKQQMAQVVGSLRGSNAQKAGPDPKEVDKFLKEFIRNPQGSMRELVQAVAHEQLAPIRSEIATGRAGTAVTAFKTSHPWLNKDDEAKIERILLNNPQLTNLGDNPREKDIISSLRSALGMYIAEDPKAYNTKVENHQNRAERDVNEAKKAAGAVGGKKGSVVQTPGVLRDAFDEVLESDAKFRAKYASK
jgi:hypothetical protein